MWWSAYGAATCITTFGKVSSSLNVLEQPQVGRFRNLRYQQLVFLFKPDVYIATILSLEAKAISLPCKMFNTLT